VTVTLSSLGENMYMIGFLCPGGNLRRPSLGRLNFGTLIFGTRPLLVGGFGPTPKLSD